ncbi:MAG: hypothetical protein AAFX99_33425 [Myxococcota bacterium]
MKQDLFSSGCINRAYDPRGNHVKVLRPNGTIAVLGCGQDSVGQVSSGQIRIVEISSDETGAD